MQCKLDINLPVPCFSERPPSPSFEHLRIPPEDPLVVDGLSSNSPQSVSFGTSFLVSPPPLYPTAL